MTDTKIFDEDLFPGQRAPRVTPKDLDDAIVSEHYFTAAQGAYGFGSNKEWFAGQEGPYGEPGRKSDVLDLLTFCVLVLKNGFTVVGKSACVSPENFDADIGRQIAYDNARNEMWPLLGYALRDKLAAGEP